MKPKPPKLVLDIVSAILCNGILARAGAKGTAKDAAKTFFQVRDELLKEMQDSERSDLPIYLTQKFPRAPSR